MANPQEHSRSHQKGDRRHSPWIENREPTPIVGFSRSILALGVISQAMACKPYSNAQLQPPGSSSQPFTHPVHYS